MIDSRVSERRSALGWDSRMGSPDQAAPSGGLLERAYRVATYLATSEEGAADLVEAAALACGWSGVGAGAPDSRRLDFYRLLVRAAEEGVGNPGLVSDRFDLAPGTDAAIRSMPLPTRAALVLHAVEDISYEQLARALGCPLETARRRLHQGRALLRSALETGSGR